MVVGCSVWLAARRGELSHCWCGSCHEQLHIPQQLLLGSRCGCLEGMKEKPLCASSQSTGQHIGCACRQLCSGWSPSALLLTSCSSPHSSRSPEGG
jgi:hypothetical protein